MNKLLEKFKSLIYADMAINMVMTNNPFNNEWRNNLNLKEREFWINHARLIAEGEQ